VHIRNMSTGRARFAWRTPSRSHHSAPPPLRRGGTGTGKTLAYLLPSMFCGRRVVISTGTKNLQEQVFFKDIPFLEEALATHFGVYLKGRSNYLCLKKLAEIDGEGYLFSLTIRSILPPSGSGWRTRRPETARNSRIS